jgi:phage tail-like protein
LRRWRRETINDLGPHRLDVRAANLAFSELSSITSQVEPNQYVTTTTNGRVVPTKQLGRTRPTTVVLKRALDPSGNQALPAWHQAAMQDSPTARTSATLTINETGGTITYVLENAWLSQLNVSGLKAGSGQAAIEAATIVCDQIIAGS